METALKPGAAAVAEDDASAAGSQYLTFALGGEEYGIDILAVQEIRSYEEPTRIVKTPDFIKGVTNLRGVIVPIVDLRLKFGLEEVPYNALTVVVVLKLKQMVVGVVVDSVSDVLSLTADQIQAAPSYNAAFDNNCIKGLALTKDGDVERMVILTDIEKLMGNSDEAFTSVAESAATVA